jgi:hypothetical protein
VRIEVALMRWRTIRSACVFGCVLLLAASAAAAQECGGRVVSRAEVVDAMRKRGTYSMAATPNAGRLAADVFIRLAAAQKARDPAATPLIIRQSDWFAAYIEVSGLPPERIPLGTRIANDHKQDMYIEHRYDRVVKRVVKGAVPRAAMNVRLAWERKPGAAQRYTYHDSSSVPEVQVTSEREVRYRLLDYGDVVMYEEMQGVSGRPTTGLLGAFFSVLGNAQVLSARMAFARDGTQLIRGRARKVFERSATATFGPDGRGDKGIPPGRSDLEVLEARVKQPLQIEYQPHHC